MNVEAIIGEHVRERRQDRMAEVIRKRLSEVIATQVQDPRIGFLTITAVEVSHDLQHATVHVSVLGDHEEQQASLKVLERIKGYLRREVGDTLQVRITPDLSFKLDHSMEEGARLLQLMRSVESEREE